MWDLVLKAAEKYILAHPEVVEKLVEDAVEFLLAKIAESKK